MRIVSTVILALLLASFVHAQQTWIRTYGGKHDDKGYSVQQTTDGGYIVTGYTYSFRDTSLGDVYLVKTNASGDTIWAKTYGGANADVGWSVQQTSDGGYIIVGQTASFGAGYSDVYLIKTNASGDTTWTRTYGGIYNDLGYSVQQTSSDGGYIVSGSTGSYGVGDGDVYLVKTNAAGDTLWTRTCGGTGDDYGYSVQQTSDGGYIVGGSTYIAGRNHDVYLIKTNASGDTLWTRTYGGTGEDIGYSVQQTTEGGYIVAGYSTSFKGGYAGVYVLKTNASGDTVWTRTYGGSYNDYGYSARQTSDGGYIITGTTYSFGAGDYDAYLIKTNAAGDTQWTRTYGGTGEDVGYSVRQTTDGGYIVAGYTSPYGGGGANDFDVYLIKTDANGNEGVEEPTGRRQEAVSSIRATPNPFASFARIPGHEGERFDLYDISGKMVGTYRGDRIGEVLSPAVYFIKLSDEHGGTLRVVKAGTRGK
jgi:hypothetical protein